MLRRADNILYSVLSSSGASAAYASDILAIMDLYFHMPMGPISSIVLLLTTQCIGFGLAGRFRARSCPRSRHGLQVCCKAFSSPRLLCTGRNAWSRSSSSLRYTPTPPPVFPKRHRFLPVNASRSSCSSSSRPSCTNSFLFSSSQPLPRSRYYA